MSKRTTAARDRADILRSDLAAAQAEYEKLAADLLERPDDRQVTANIKALEAEIAEHRTAIARLEAAQLEAKRRDSAESKAEELESIKADADQLVKNFARLGEVDAAIVAALAPIGGLVAERNALAGDNSGLLWHVLKAGFGRKTGEGKFGGRANLVRGIQQRGPLIDAIYAAFAEANLEPWISVSPARSAEPLGERVRQGALALRDTLDEAIKHREAELEIERREAERKAAK